MFRNTLSVMLALPSLLISSGDARPFQSVNTQSAWTAEFKDMHAVSCPNVGIECYIPTAQGAHGRTCCIWKCCALQQVELRNQKVFGAAEKKQTCSLDLMGRNLYWLNCYFGSLPERCRALERAEAVC